MSFKEKYKKEADALRFSSDCNERFAEAMKNASEGNRSVPVTKKKKAALLLAAVITIMLVLSVGTVAEPSQHSPDATTVQYQSSVTDYEDRWKGSKKFPYEKGDENYTLTVLGIASGEFLNSCDGFSADEGREYFVTAVRGRDGTRLSPDTAVKIIPLIYGRDPSETDGTALCKDVRITEKNGVIYYLFDTSFLEGFEGRTVCFAAFEGDNSADEVFTMDEKGVISFSQGYRGSGYIIELPRDLSDTHPERAEEMLLSDELSGLH